MSCKSCKAKKKAEKLSNQIQSNISGFQSDMDAQKEAVIEKMFSDGGGSVFLPWQKIVLVIVAWIPLAVGYFTIIKFIISLF